MGLRGTAVGPDCGARSFRGPVILCAEVFGCATYECRAVRAASRDFSAANPDTLAASRPPTNRPPKMLASAITAPIDPARTPMHVIAIGLSLDGASLVMLPEWTDRQSRIQK